jgi:hypothetical protein
MPNGIRVDLELHHSGTGMSHSVVILIVARDGTTPIGGWVEILVLPPLRNAEAIVQTHVVDEATMAVPDSFLTTQISMKRAFKGLHKPQVSGGDKPSG